MTALLLISLLPTPDKLWWELHRELSLRDGRTCYLEPSLRSVPGTDEDPMSARLLALLSSGPVFSVYPGGYGSAGLGWEGDVAFLWAEPALFAGDYGRSGVGWQPSRTGLLGYDDSLYAGFTRLLAGVRFGPLKLSLGRDLLRWGPTPSSSFSLSDAAGPLEMARAEYRSGPFSFQFLIGDMERYIHLGDTLYGDSLYFRDGWLTKGEAVSRFLIGKRLEYSGSTWAFSFAETGVYGTYDGGFVPVALLNPVNSLYFYQWNSGDNTNALWELQAARRFGRGMLYLSLLVDDFQFDPAYWDSIPPDLGVALGGFWALPSGLLSAEYYLLTAWTYNNKSPWLKYSYYGVSPGGRGGPDIERVYLRYVHHVGSLDVTGGPELVRKGENSLATVDLGAAGLYPGNYLLGDVTTTAGVWLGARYHFGRGFLGVEGWAGPGPKMVVSGQFTL